jgi:hypothetical protein
MYHTSLNELSIWFSLTSKGMVTSKESCIQINSNVDMGA